MKRKDPFRGSALKVALYERGLTQKECAALLGMRYSSFNMRVLGERHFTASERGKLSEILGRGAEELFPKQLDSPDGQNTQELMGV